MGQAQMSKNSVFWEVFQLEIHIKNYMLNFFHAKYLLKYSFLIMQQFDFIIFLFYKLFFNMVVKSKFHASWQCVIPFFYVGWKGVVEKGNNLLLSVASTSLISIPQLRLITLAMNVQFVHAPRIEGKKSRLSPSN